MTYPINYQNQQIPGYSGITINITNPNIGAFSPNSQPQQHLQGVCTDSCCTGNNSRMSNPISQISSPDAVKAPLIKSPQEFVQVPDQQSLQTKTAPLTYPPEYYINNYNYVQNDKSIQQNSSQGVESGQSAPKEIPSQDMVPENPPKEVEEDMSSSKNIINELDTKLNEQKELEKNGKKTRIVVLTNEYIMSLENSLNNPNSEIRLMAAKEILTRLDEDKDRFDDAALNALLNKMLQDPEKLVRMAALSAFSSQLASGNNYTVKLLTDIQSDPNADKDDVVDAANILLKMSAATEVKYVPQKSQDAVVEQKVE